MKRFHYALLSGTLSVSMALGVSSALWTPTAYASTAPPPEVNGWVQVSTANQLDYIDQHQSSYLSSNIELMNDIKMPVGSNWTPIATYKGTFNGQGYEITGLTIMDNSDFNVGFFGATYGIIENLGVDATVSSSKSSPSIGGLVGAQMSGNIVNSYATGSVTGSGPVSQVGGLVGYSHGKISNSYATGSATSGASSSSVGGLVGWEIQGSITNSYATGHVSATGSYSQAGGLVGGNGGGSNISHSYFDTQTTGVSGGQTTTAMHTQLTYIGWDFTNTWAMDAKVNSGYPYHFHISTASPAMGIAGQAYPNVTLTALDGAGGSLTWTATGLPPNMALSSSGVLSGTPTQSGKFAVSVSVKNDAGNTAKTTLKLLVEDIITYDGNGSTGGSVPTDSNTYTSGSSVTVKGNTGNLVRTGYTFGGWTTQANGSGTVYQSNDTLKMPSSSVTLYAKWNPIPYTVTFNSNGGSSIHSETVDYNGTATKPTDPTKTGYTFAGWYSDSGLTTPYSFSTPVTGNQTLYAQWRVDPSISTSSTLPNVLEGAPYTQGLQGAGGMSPYTFSIHSGSLPDGLTLQSDGNLVGASRQSGTFHFTVQLKDHAGTTTTKKMSLYVIPTAPTGYLKTIDKTQVVGGTGGTLTTKSGDTTETLIVTSGTFANPLQMDITSGALPSNLIPQGWNLVGAYGVNFDAQYTPSSPISFTLLNPGITPQSKVYKIVNAKLIPVIATVTHGKAVMTFTTDPDFVVLQPQPVPQATKPVTGFPAFPWTAGGALAILTGGLILWWQRHRKTFE